MNRQPRRAAARQGPRDLEAAPAVVPPAVAALFRTGVAYQQAGRPIDAMLCYRRALKANRNSVQAQFHLGEVLRALAREDDGVLHCVL